MTLADHWPLFGLEVRTPRLALRYPDDDLALELVELAERGIHEPGTMPFAVPWTDDPPRAHLQHLWRNRSEWGPARWHCQLVAIECGAVVGTQGMIGEHFAARRVVETGSWVGAAHQGRGVGTEMRAAVLHLAFAGLGAQQAITAAWHDNERSRRVTERMGYEPNGWSTELRRDKPDRMDRFVLERGRWEARRRDDIEIIGLAACRELFGLG